MNGVKKILMALKTTRADQALMYCRASPCVACGMRPPSEVDHIRTRGAGAGDEHWEIWPLCRRHHQEKHGIGLYTFTTKYDLFKQLEMRGWEFDGNKLRRK